MNRPPDRSPLHLREVFPNELEIQAREERYWQQVEVQRRAMLTPRQAIAERFGRAYYQAITNTRTTTTEAQPSSEPVPVAEARPAIAKPKPVAKPKPGPRTCPVCGGEVTGKVTKVYCKPKCRKKAQNRYYYAKQKARDDALAEAQAANTNIPAPDHPLRTDVEPLLGPAPERRRGESDFSKTRRTIISEYKPVVVLHTCAYDECGMTFEPKLPWQRYCRPSHRRADKERIAQAYPDVDTENVDHRTTTPTRLEPVTEIPSRHEAS